MVDEELELANSARMYDYLLGGAQNFAADREAVHAALARFPSMARSAQANRAFLRRVVRYCYRELGIRQFLDLGSGVPTVGNVHEIAQALDPTGRVVYVDHEPVAVAHARRLLADTPGVEILQADLTDPAMVYASPEAAILDLTEPVAVLLLSVLHFVPEDRDPGGAIRAYLERLVPGSAVAISHISDDQPTEADAAPHREVARVFAQTASPAYLRDRTQIGALFAGHPLVAPGLVDANDWHPDPSRRFDAGAPAEHPDRCGYYAGLAVIG